MTADTALTEDVPTIKVTVTEETTATYLVTPEWLEKNGFPVDQAELTDYLSNGFEYAPDGEDPVEALTLKLYADDDMKLDEFSVTERDLYIDASK